MILLRMVIHDFVLSQILDVVCSNGSLILNHLADIISN